MFAIGLFIFAHTSPVYAARENVLELGINNTYSAGAIDSVPDGFGLTAIGYGSDDWKCVIGIKTAPVNPDGTVDSAGTAAP